MKYLIIATYLTSISVFGLTAKEAQDIRYAKAISLISNENEEKGVSLLRKNLKPPFHYKTTLFLARHFYEKKEFTKSFRLYQHILNNTFDSKIVEFTYNPQLKSLLTKRLKKISKPRPEALLTSFEFAEKFFEVYQEKIFPVEFLKSLLNLSEKYFRICAHFNLYPAPTHIYLSKIETIRGNDSQAINLLTTAKKQLKDNPDDQLGVKEQDIDLLLSEAFARVGQIETSTNLLRSLYSKDNLSPSTSQYAKTFLKELNTSYFNTTFTYQVRRRQNIYQLEDSQYSSFDDNQNLKSRLKEKDNLIHHRHLNFYMNKQLNQDLSFKAGIDYTNEKTFTNGLPGTTSDQLSFTLGVNKYQGNDSYYSFDYDFSRLGGRRLENLFVIQSRRHHTFTPGYYWNTVESQWKWTLPIEFESYEGERSATGLSIALTYSPIIKSKFWSPEVYGSLGRRSEGELLPSSLFFQMGASNFNEINDKFGLLSFLDFYKNSNSDASLDFSELTIDAVLSYKYPKIRGLSLELEIIWRRRSYGTGEVIPMNDIGLGATYNF